MKKLLLLCVCACLLFACEKEEKLGKGNIQFEFTQVESGLKSANSTYPSKLLISVQNVSTNENVDTVIDILMLNDEYIIEPLAMIEGSYQLTKFIIKGDTNQVLYACPKEGSEHASFVSDALPINFSIVKDETSNLNVEVLSAEHLTPESFGYIQIDWVEVATFDILISPRIYSNSEAVFAPVKLEIKSGTDWVYTDSLLSVTNMVMVKDSFSNYTITISKDGYSPFVQSFNSDELKKYFSVLGPLTVVLYQDGDLARGLKAYYPFNGNSIDESGNGFNGTVNGAVLTSDRKGVANSAYYFDGVDDYIDLGFAPELRLWAGQPYSFSVWIKNVQSAELASIFSKHYSAGAGSMEFFLAYESATGELMMVMHDQGNSANFNKAAISFSSSDWSHICVVSEGDNLKLFVDKVLKDSVLLDVTTVSATEAKFMIGAINKSVTNPDRFFKGSIDDLRVYHRALSETEINALYSE